MVRWFVTLVNVKSGKEIIKNIVRYITKYIGMKKENILIKLSV
jgi:hypothetical protein